MCVPAKNLVEHKKEKVEIKIEYRVDVSSYPSSELDTLPTSNLMINCSTMIEAMRCKWLCLYIK